MARYTDERTFSFGAYPEYRAFSVKANGGSISVAKWDGQEWITDTDDDVSTDKNGRIFTQNCNVRITPTGGATYSIDESVLWA